MPQSKNGDVKIKRLAQTPDADIWLVRGKKVRDKLNVWFVEGAHGYVGKFSKIIPKNEVWIDDALHKDEYNAVIIHELYERELMKKGMPYEKAHERANLVEIRARRKPRMMKKNLERRGVEPFFCNKCLEWHSFNDKGKIYERHLGYNHNE